MEKEEDERFGAVRDDHDMGFVGGFRLPCSHADRLGRHGRCCWSFHLERRCTSFWKVIKASGYGFPFNSYSFGPWFIDRIYS